MCVTSVGVCDSGRQIMIDGAVTLLNMKDQLKEQGESGIVSLGSNLRVRAIWASGFAHVARSCEPLKVRLPHMCTGSVCLSILLFACLYSLLSSTHQYPSILSSA